jgi:hypothetical protein
MTTEQGRLIHNLDRHSKKKVSILPIMILLFMAIIIGIGIGYGISKMRPNATSISTKGGTVAKIQGVADKKTFKDNAEGILREGGLENEGNFHLERTGGKSQNVYLTSSTVDLSQFVGKKVRVWGETFASDKAGWLMDVGLVEAL